MIASPYSTFTADRGHGFPIGSTYEVIDPARLAYWDPSLELPETTSTRRAMACPWSPPIPRIHGPKSAPNPALNLFEQMFGESQP
jgi:hypothetical protein